VRTFVLAEGMEVTAATLEHGLLHIDLAAPNPSAWSAAFPSDQRGLNPASSTVEHAPSGRGLNRTRQGAFPFRRRWSHDTQHPLPRSSRRSLRGPGRPDLVYVRPIKAAEILADVPVGVTEDFNLSPDQTLYAVCRADGARLAVMIDKDTAVAAALAHELAPVSVH
jgi:hypothetical protein